MLAQSAASLNKAAFRHFGSLRKPIPTSTSTISSLALVLSNPQTITLTSRTMSTAPEPPLPIHSDPKKNFAPTELAQWGLSDEYHNSFLIRPDPALDGAIENSARNGLRDIAVSKAQGKFLKLLVRSLGVKRILEVGTLGGYAGLISRISSLKHAYNHSRS